MTVARIDTVPFGSFDHKMAKRYSSPPAAACRRRVVAKVVIGSGYHARAVMAPRNTLT